MTILLDILFFGNTMCAYYIKYVVNRSSFTSHDSDCGTIVEQWSKCIHISTRKCGTHIYLSYNCATMGSIDVKCVTFTRNVSLTVGNVLLFMNIHKFTRNVPYSYVCSCVSHICAPLYKQWTKCIHNSTMC
jgi:hypothetical protein